MLLIHVIACTLPLSGTYAFEVVDERSDCGDAYDGLEDPDGDQTIEVEADKVILLSDEGEDEECDRDDLSFSCEFESADDTVTAAPMSAEVVVDFSFEGTWVASTRIEGTITADIECTGEDCDYFAEQGMTDCRLEWEYIATRK